jgi:hypothetical protein
MKAIRQALEEVMKHPTPSLNKAIQQWMRKIKDEKQTL